MICPGCNTQNNTVIARIDGLIKYKCKCGMYFSTREIVVMRGYKDVLPPKPVEPGSAPRYPRSKTAADAARAIARHRNENKKD